jgi:hypothetical protein
LTTVFNSATFYPLENIVDSIHEKDPSLEYSLLCRDCVFFFRGEKAVKKLVLIQQGFGINFILQDLEQSVGTNIQPSK